MLDIQNTLYQPFAYIHTIFYKYDLLENNKLTKTGTGMIEKIKDYYDIDLTEDEELIKNLQIHLMGLKNRIEHNTF